MPNTCNIHQLCIRLANTDNGHVYNNDVNDDGDGDDDGDEVNDDDDDDEVNDDNDDDPPSKNLPTALTYTTIISW